MIKTIKINKKLKKSEYLIKDLREIMKKRVREEILKIKRENWIRKLKIESINESWALKP